MLRALRSSSRALLVAFCLGSLGLLLAGCDSGGSSSPDPTEFTVTVENVGPGSPVLKSGAFVSPTNQSGPAPITGGESYQFSFTAGPNEIPDSGMRLSFATMFIQSNDLYYAFEPGGLSLFDGSGTPIGQNGPANVTANVNLYDAGTEVDQTPGEGPDQAPRQDALNTGPSGEGSVAEVTDTDGDGRLENDGFSYPSTEDVIEVVVESQQDSESGGFEFTVTITNRGASVNGAPIPLSPGSFAVHWDQNPANDGAEVTYPGHAPGSEAGDGIQAIAEDGRPNGALPPDNGAPAGNHVQALQEITGVTVPLSPGAYAVHSDEVTFHNPGSSASPGIEAIAEDGRPSGALPPDNGTPAGNFVQALRGTDGVKTAGAFGTPEGADSPGPRGPGGSYSFSVEATPGDRLSLATMHIQSNDFYYATPQEGVALFNGNDQPIEPQEIEVFLYDAGTEGDQEPGVGLDQAPRQSTLNTGPSGEGTITRVSGSNDGYSYPTPDEIIEVTITPPSASQ